MWTTASLCNFSGKVYPCWGTIYALSGSTGQVKWTLNVRSEIFLFNCEEIDADGDGKIDCIGTGRQATTVAFNPRTGISGCSIACTNLPEN